jgi:hypothetical protein
MVAFAGILRNHPECLFTAGKCLMKFGMIPDLSRGCRNFFTGLQERVTFHGIKDQEQSLVAGDVLQTRKGVPPTYRVESVAEGRCQTVTVRGDFERFVRAVSRPAERPELPALAGPPSAAAKHGIELVGLPIQ